MCECEIMQPGERTKNPSVFSGRRVEGRTFRTALLHKDDGLTAEVDANNNFAVSVNKSGNCVSAAAVGDVAHPHGLECEGDGMRKRPRRQEETCGSSGRNGNRNKNVIISSEEEKAAAAFRGKPGRMINGGGGGGCDHVPANQIKK